MAGKYGVHDLSLKILRKSPRYREFELLTASGKYRDEEYKEYLKKKQQFLNAAKYYAKLNEETAIIQKDRLISDYNIDVNFEFLVDEPEIPACDDNCSCNKSEPSYLKKRAVKPIDSKFEVTEEKCCIERWSLRFIILNRFIHVAWKVIRRNRLTKVLKVLRTLNKQDVEELERKHRKCYNVTYRESFEKFIQ